MPNIQTKEKEENVKYCTPHIAHVVNITSNLDVNNIIEVINNAEWWTAQFQIICPRKACERDEISICIYRRNLNDMSIKEPGKLCF